MESIFKTNENIVKDESKFSEILEQESMEVDTPLHPPRVSKDYPYGDNSGVDSSQFLVPERFSKE